MKTPELSMLRECSAAINALLKDKPFLAAHVYGSTTLGNLRVEIGAAIAQATLKNPNPWVVVSSPGQDDEDIVADFPTHKQAVRFLIENREDGDILKRLVDGSLTTEF